MNLVPILDAPPQVQVHLLAALAAFALGSVILLNRKGTSLHKRLGWTYVILMTVTATSAFLIRRDVPGFSAGGFTPIHLFIVLTAVSLPMAILHIKAGRVRQHAGAMIGLFVGALLIAGALTLLPGRIMHAVFFR